MEREALSSVGIHGLYEETAIKGRGFHGLLENELRLREKGVVQ